MEALKALGMLKAIRGKWAERQARVRALQSTASENGGALSAMSKSFRILFQSLILALGALLAIDDIITPGAMIVGSILLGRALSPIEMLLGAWRQWINVGDAHGRLVELLARYPATAPGMPLPAPKGSLSVEGITAVPPGGNVPVLRNVSFRLEPGVVLLVLGPSAAGKSTLARLLVGLWPAVQGKVRLDGADVFTWDKDELGPHVGYLPQDIGLFEGSVAENVGRFGPMNGQAIVAAAKLAGVHDMILRLPQGYETQIGADGAALSGGQRQRIALARALYGQPHLVVLDEPNSNLDEAGEAALKLAIEHLQAGGCTVIVIAHGQQLIAAATRLLVLRDGNMMAFGPRDKVLEYLRENGVKAIAAPHAAGAA